MTWAHLPLLAALAAALAPLAARAEAPEPEAAGDAPKGEVHPVAGGPDGAVLYQCYLPKAFDAARRWPVVFGFSAEDLGAAEAAKRWAEVAEARGWVVAWSDRPAKDDADPKDVKALCRALLAGLEARVPVQAGRCYATGLGPGARRAVAMACTYPDKFAGVLVEGAFLPPMRVEVPKHLAVFAVAARGEAALRELQAAKAALEERGNAVELKTFDAAKGPAPARLLEEGAAWLTRRWFIAHDDLSPEGRKERLAVAEEMFKALQDRLKDEDRSGAYEAAQEFLKTFSNTTHDALKALLAKAKAVADDLEKDVSVAGMKAYKVPAPEAVVAAFLKAVEADAAFEAPAKADARRIVEAARGDAEALPDALAAAVGRLHPALASGLGALLAEDTAAALATLKPLEESPDAYLAAHAAYFEGRALVLDERYEEALAPLAKVAGPWIEKTLFAGDSLFLVGLCQGRLLRRPAALRVLQDFLKHYPEAPERMRVGADHVARLIQAIQEGSLSDVQDRMDDSRRRLKLERSGKPTQERQERIIAMLDKLIKEAEEREQQGGGGGGGGGGGSGGGQQPGASGPPSGNNTPSGPAASSSAPAGEASIGALDRIRRGSADEVWGKARQRERERVLNVLKSKFPERYQELLEQYYKSLQESKP